MTAKEWLGRARELDREIDVLEQAKRKAYIRCTSAVARLGRVPGGGPASDGGLSSYADFAALVDRCIDRLTDIRQETLAVIGEVGDPTLRTLLTLRYLNFEPWEKIADRLHYSRRQILRLHGEALQRIREITGLS